MGKTTLFSQFSTSILDKNWRLGLFTTLRLEALQHTTTHHPHSILIRTVRHILPKCQQFRETPLSRNSNSKKKFFQCLKQKNKRAELSSKRQTFSASSIFKNLNIRERGSTSFSVFHIRLHPLAQIAEPTYLTVKFSAAHPVLSSKTFAAVPVEANRLKFLFRFFNPSTKLIT